MNEIESFFTCFGMFPRSARACFYRYKNTGGGAGGPGGRVRGGGGGERSTAGTFMGVRLSSPKVGSAAWGPRRTK